MVGTFDVILVNIMIDMEVQNGSSTREIIDLINSKYPKMPGNVIMTCIWNRRKEWVRHLLENYHFLNSWGIHEHNWDWYCSDDHVPKYKVYKDVPEGYILKIMLEEALEVYGERDPKIRALLVLKYIEPRGVTTEEIKKIFSISNNTVYSWLDKGLLDIGKIMAKENKKKLSTNY